MKLYGSYFCGNKISDYGIENGFLDYATLAKAFDAVLNNDIMAMTADIGYWDIVSGFQADEDGEESDYFPEVFQYYIVSDSGAEILREIGEVLFYNDTLDMYIWGVTHYGTNWSYVLTNVPCNCGKAALERSEAGA